MPNRPDFYQKLYEAMRESFQRSDLERALAARIDFRLADVSGKDDTMPETVHALVSAFKERGTLDVLLRVLVQERPAVTQFAVLYDRYMAALQSERQAEHEVRLSPESGAHDLLGAVHRLERTVQELGETVDAAGNDIAEMQSALFGTGRSGHRGLVESVDTLRTLAAELRCDLADHLQRYEAMKLIAIGAALLALFSIIGLFFVIGKGAL